MSYFYRTTSRIHHAIVWTVMLAFGLMLVPVEYAAAATMTATLERVTGDVLVNSYTARSGMTLRQGDVISTQAGAVVTVKLNDDSRVTMQQNTTCTLTQLVQTAQGDRKTVLQLERGTVGAQLSEAHQTTGSSFEVGTPNARIAVTMSLQPEVEVMYDEESEETIAMSDTVVLTALNIMTNEQVMVPVGQGVIISAIGIKLVSGGTAATVLGAASTEAGTTGTGTAASGTVVESSTTGGLGKGTIIAIGAGTAAAVGGVAILASGSDDDDDDSDSEDTSTGIFTGTFKNEGPASNNSNWYMTNTFTLTQRGNSIAGEFTQTASYCCTATVTSSVSGQAISENEAQLSFTSPGARCDCSGGGYGGVFAVEYNDIAVISTDGTGLLLPQLGIFIRQ